MDKNLREKLRFFKIDVLNFLHILSSTDSLALDLEDISQSTATAEGDLKGIIATLRRTKVKGESLIQPAGRDSRGRLRWKINQVVLDKKELAKFLEEEILGKEGISWQKAK